MSPRLGVCAALLVALALTACPDDAPAGGDTSSDAVSDAVADSVSDAVADSVSDAVADSVSDSVPDSASDAVSDAVPDSVSDSESDAVADSVSDSVPDSASDAVSDSDAVADSESDAVPDSESDAVTDSVSDAVTDSVSDSESDSVPDAVTDPDAEPDIGPDTSDCTYFEVPIILSCDPDPLTLLFWSDWGDPSCPTYVTDFSGNEYPDTDAAADALSCDPGCVYQATTAVSFLTCQGPKSGYDVYEAEGCGTLYGTPDGIFANLCDWDAWACNCDPP